MDLPQYRDPQAPIEVPDSVDALSESSQSPVFYVEQKCTKCMAPVGQPFLTLSAKGIQIYKVVADFISSAMGCPCDLYCCIQGFKPSQTITTLFNYKEWAKWHAPSGVMAPDIALVELNGRVKKHW